MMEEWEELEEAMAQARWFEAAAGARELLEAWQGVKGSLLWFANGEVEAAAERFEIALSTLVTELERQPVDTQAVEKARREVLVFAGPPASGQ